MENSRNDKIIELLEYATRRRDAELSDGELNDVIYWNGYIDGLKRVMAVIKPGRMVEIGDIVTAKCNLDYTITGKVIIIDNRCDSSVPSILVQKGNDKVWCYLSDNPELKVPKVFEKMEQEELNERAD